ncbi:hypothetical protein [Aquimarina algicola]|uniref:Uncharacterized protein n=1 Tax=Aquimarina algicola TaxID=2589995 RepID=A0A504JM62_9FLAO|nr:hypothetical protein [Aquimarina algicola]TPN88838.1 hypothetical protein FHK87_01090 [Aquimarina algicola]
MAYNNNRGNYNNGYQNQNQQQNAKKSGAVYKKISKGDFQGKDIINAWNKSRSRGMITATVAPYYNTDYKKPVESESGHRYVKMMAVVTYQSSGQEKKIPCLMNMSTRVVVLQEIGMVISPNGSGHTSSGKKVTGYFGKFTR